MCQKRDMQTKRIFKERKTGNEEVDKTHTIIKGEII